MWGNPLNQKNIALFKAIKSKEISAIYKEFIGMKEMFISRKFKEKVKAQDTKEPKNNKYKIQPNETKSSERILRRQRNT